jgi:hypothetical protein
MAGLLNIADIEARKRALVGESEIYRETLRLEYQNLRLYALATRKKLALARSAKPALLIGLPLLGSFLMRRGRAAPRSRLGVLKSAFSMWRMYRTYGPLIRAAMAKWMSRSGAVDRETSQPHQ